MTGKTKLMVFMIDALCETDVDYMRTLPNFKWILDNGALAKRVNPVYPSFTYPCHVSIMTGMYPDKHGIPHNEHIQAGEKNVAWYRLRKDIRAKLLIEYAKEHGYSTCAINWPVSAGADIDYNLPMSIPMMYHGDNPRQFLDGVSTKELLDKYYWKYGYMLRHLCGSINGSLDTFTMAVAPEIIRDYHQPDVMFVKMCDLDSVRHARGVETDEAKDQLVKHDCELGVIMESVRRFGDFDNTNFVIMGDHGQTDVKTVVNFNVALQQAGLQTVDAQGRLVSFDAYCHSTGVSAWIELRDNQDKALWNKVYQLLLSVKEKHEYGIGYVFTKEEAKAQYHLDGPFDFIIEGGPESVSFGNELTGPIVSATHPGDYKTAPGSHGGLPFVKHQTTFFGCGPAFKKGAVIEEASLVDEAPTMAKMLGFEMADVDGRVLTELLND